VKYRVLVVHHILSYVDTGRYLNSEEGASTKPSLRSGENVGGAQ